MYTKVITYEQSKLFWQFPIRDAKVITARTTMSQVWTSELELEYPQYFSILETVTKIV